jgi:hypothetical protein
MVIKAAHMVQAPARKKPAAKPKNRPSLKVGSMGSHGGKVKIEVAKPKKKEQRYSAGSHIIKASNIIKTAGKIRPQHKKNVKVEDTSSTDVKMRPWNKRKQGNINNTSYVKTYKSSSYIDDLTKGEDNGTMG